jgi:hypothetical protein
MSEYDLMINSKWINWGKVMSFRIKIIIISGIVLLAIGSIIAIIPIFTHKWSAGNYLYSFVFITLSIIIISITMVVSGKTKFYRDKISRMFYLDEIRKEGKNFRDPMVILGYIRDSLEKRDIKYNIDFQVTMGYLRLATIKIIGKPYFIFFEPHYYRSADVYRLLISVGPVTNIMDTEIQNIIKLVDWSLNPELSPL